MSRNKTGRHEVSRHEIAVYRALCDAGQTWLAIRDIAERAEVARRTAHAHAVKLAELGVANRVDVFPGHRYRLAEHATERNREYLDRLNRAAEVLENVEQVP